MKIGSSTLCIHVYIQTYMKCKHSGSWGSGRRIKECSLCANRIKHKIVNRYHFFLPENKLNVSVIVKNFIAFWYWLKLFESLWMLSESYAGLWQKIFKQHRICWTKFMKALAKLGSLSIRWRYVSKIRHPNFYEATTKL